MGPGRRRHGSEFRPEPTRRLANLVDKGALFADIDDHAEDPPAMDVGGPGFKLSRPQRAFDEPHNGEVAQPVARGHRRDRRRARLLGLQLGVGLLDDFTAENGATRMIPVRTPGVASRARHHGPAARRRAFVTGRAGTVVIMNAHMWHGGIANRTDRCRQALHAFYTRDDKPAAAVPEGAAASGDRRGPHPAAAWVPLQTIPRTTSGLRHHAHGRIPGRFAPHPRGAPLRAACSSVSAPLP